VTPPHLHEWCEGVTETGKNRRAKEVGVNPKMNQEKGNGNGDKETKDEKRTEKFVGYGTGRSGEGNRVGYGAGNQFF
jgi:hypothetical protein